MRPVLQSWKEISAYVGRTARTLQRWERAFGFPVHRPAGRSRSAVVALVDEIQKWTLDRPSLGDIRAVRRIKPEKLSQHAPVHKLKLRKGCLEAEVTAPVLNTPNESPTLLTRGSLRVELTGKEAYAPMYGTSLCGIRACAKICGRR